MLHYSCDLCKRPIDPQADVRHVVKIEVFQPVEDAEPLDACATDERGEDEDHLEEMQDLLDSMDERDLEREGLFGEGTQSLRFDLCDACRQRFLRNPLGIKAGKKLDFSQN